MVDLKNHLLGRVLQRDFDGDDRDTFSPNDRNTIRIINNRLYRTSTARINYTTYDIRRDYDTINPRRQCFVMVKSPETEPGSHPYWYAKVLGVFHTLVQHVGTHSINPKPQRMEFLWVRWLGVEPGYQAGRRRARLPKIGFVPDSDDYAFGFLDPSLVIRGSHLIPVFSDGRTNELLRTTSPTAARDEQEVDDWVGYYVNM